LSARWPGPRHARQVYHAGPAPVPGPAPGRAPGRAFAAPADPRAPGGRGRRAVR